VPVVVSTGEKNAAPPVVVVVSFVVVEFWLGLGSFDLDGLRRRRRKGASLMLSPLFITVVVVNDRLLS